MSQAPISPLRRRMIEDMTVRGFGEKTQSDYIRHVRNFTLFLGRSPDQAQSEDLRLYQVHQREQGVQPPTMNGAVAALRFFFTTTCNRPDVKTLRTVTPRKKPPSPWFRYGKQQPEGGARSAPIVTPGCDEKMQECQRIELG